MCIVKMGLLRHSEQKYYYHSLCRPPNKCLFIATQLSSTRRRVELRRRVSIDTSPTQSTQLNVDLSWVELRRYRHPHWVRRSELIGDSCSRCRVELSCVAINGPALWSTVLNVSVCFVSARRPNSVLARIRIWVKVNTNTVKLWFAL